MKSIDEDSSKIRYWCRYSKTLKSILVDTLFFSCLHINIYLEKISLCLNQRNIWRVSRNTMKFLKNLMTLFKNTLVQHSCAHKMMYCTHDSLVETFCFKIIYKLLSTSQPTFSQTKNTIHSNICHFVAQCFLFQFPWCITVSINVLESPHMFLYVYF